MFRCHFALLLVAAGCLLACGCAAGDRKERKIKGWGTAIDPNGDCTIEPDNDTLTITVPGTAHDLGVEHGQMSAPRVLRQVKGDFTAQVLVAGTVRPEGPGTLQDRLPFNGAGLLLWQDDNNYILLQRASFLTPQGFRSFYASFELRKDGEVERFAASSDLSLADQDTYLRLTRRGDKISAAASQDGKEWKSLEPKTIKLSRDLQVGVAAVNTSRKPFKVRFKNFKLTPEAKD